MALFGQTTAGVHLTLLMVNALTTVFVFLLGRKLFGMTAGLVACASYGLCRSARRFWAWRRTRRNLSSLFAVPATLLLWQAVETNGRWRAFFQRAALRSGVRDETAGNLFWRCLAFCFCSGARSGPGLLFQPDSKKDAWGFAWEWLAVCARCLFLACGRCLSQILVLDFQLCRFLRHQRIFGRRARQNLRLFPKTIRDFTPDFSMLAVRDWWWPGETRPFNGKRLSRWPFVIFLSGHGLGLYFREHYFILMLPAFGILVGMAVVSLQEALPSGTWANYLRIVPLLLFAGVLGVGHFSAAPVFFPTACGSSLPEHLLRSRLSKHLSWPDTSGSIRHPTRAWPCLAPNRKFIFIRAAIRPPAIIYTYALMEPQPYALKMQREMIAEIESNSRNIWCGS